MEYVANYFQFATQSRIRLFKLNAKMENKKRKAENMEFLFSEDSQDLSYQHKYAQLMELEFVDSKLKIVTVKVNYAANGLNLSDSPIPLDSKQEEILRALLGDVSHRSNTDDSSRNQPPNSSDMRKPASKKGTVLIEYITRLKYAIVELQTLFPNTFHPVFDPRDKWHQRMLEEWLEKPSANVEKSKSVGGQTYQNPYVHKNYAILLLNENKPKLELPVEKGPPNKKTKDIRTEQPVVNEPEVYNRHKTIQEGINNREISCICLYICEQFSQYYTQTSGEEIFENAYDLIGDTFLTNGIITDSTQRSLAFTFLHFFYCLLDCYPRFKLYAYSRLRKVGSKLGPGGVWRDLFQAETDLIKLSKAEVVDGVKLSDSREYLRDMAMLLVLEFDNTQDLFLATINLLEYLCSSSQRFYFLGLFLGDFYHEKVFGSPQGRDEEKRKNYYELAEKSGKLLDKTVFHARVRLSVVYQNFFEAYSKQNVSTPTTPRLTETQLNQFYKRIYDINNYLLQENHPIALGFFATHYVKCYDLILDRIEQPVKRAVVKHPVETVLAKRRESLDKAAEYLRALFLLGDTVYLDLYYRLLRLLKYSEIFFVAARLIGAGKEENLFVPMAYCKEKGIGGGGVNYKFALKTYKKAIVAYSREKDLFKVGLVLYRVALIFSKGGQPHKAKPLFAKALVYVLFSSAKNDDKRFLVHLAYCLEQVEFPEKHSIIKKIYEGAYSVYPKNPREFILHYEIEQKIKDKYLTQNSLTKTDVNLMSVDLVLVESFEKERILSDSGFRVGRKLNQTIQDMKRFIKHEYLKCLQERNQLKHETMETFNMENHLVDVELLTQYDYGASFIESNIDLEKIDLDVPLNHISLHHDPEADQRYAQIESLIEGNSKSGDNEQETEFDMILEDILKKNDNLNAMRSLADGITQCWNVNTQRASLTFFDTKIIIGRFIKNNQLCRIFEIKIRRTKKDLIEFTEKLDHMLTYHPFLLNYLGIKSDRSAPKKSPNDHRTVEEDQYFVINLYSEYFDFLGSNLPNGYLSREHIPVDKMHEMSYQIIHIIRSFHTVGRTIGFVNSMFMAITPDFDIHFILPFFLSFFDDLKAYINKEGHNEQELRHIAPEWADPNAQLGTIGHFFPMFRTEMADPNSDLSKFWKRTSAGDIWSLGVLLYELFEAKPFFTENLQPVHPLRALRNPKTLEMLLATNLKHLSNETPQFVQKIIRGCLNIDPLKRPSIEEVVAVYEEILYNQIYRLPPMTISHYTKQMYINVYFDMNRKKAEPYLKIDSSRDVRMILPKGYVYLGKCDPRLPHGEGKIWLGDSLVISSLYFQHGMLSTECSLNLSRTDRLDVFFNHTTVEEIDPVTMATKEQKLMSSYPNRINIVSTAGRTHVEKLGKEYFGEASEYFVRNSWLPDKEVITRYFDRFSKYPNRKEPVKMSANGQRPAKQGILSKYSRYPWSENEKKFSSEYSKFHTAVKADAQRNESDLEKLKEVLPEYIQLVEKSSKSFDKLYKQQDNEPRSNQYYTIVLDPFGNLLRVAKVLKPKLNNAQENEPVLSPWQGVYFTPLETALCFETSIFMPLIDQYRLFHCRIQNFAVCESEVAILNFRDLHNKIKDSRFFNAWVTVLESKPKQFSGEICEDGPVKGRLYVDETSYMDINRSESGAYKAIVINSLTGLEYEGSLENMRKNGFGQLSRRGKLVYTGYFRDGKPHGKGMCFDENRNDTVIFRGVFKNGMKRYGTSIIYNNKTQTVMTEGSAALSLEEFSKDPFGQASVNSLVPNNKSSAVRMRAPASSQELSQSQEERIEYFGLFFFDPSLASQTTEHEDVLVQFVEQIKKQGCFRVIGSKRKKRAFPIYFGEFIEQAVIQLDGAVKVDFDKGSYFFGRYSGKNSHRTGQGVRVYEDGKKLIGNWNGDTCQGYLQHTGDSEEKFCEGHFQVREDHQQVEQFGQGKIHYRDGRTYIGEISRSKPCGFGKLSISLDMAYEGQFLDGQYHGIGCIFDFKKLVFKEGEFSQGQMHGCGIFKKGGLKIPGFWKDDKMVLICSDDYSMTLNDWRIKQVVSPVKFNEIEYLPTKHGNCEILLKKLYDGSTFDRSEMCRMFLNIILKSVLCPKHAADLTRMITFEICFEAAVQYLNCYTGHNFKFDLKVVKGNALTKIKQEHMARHLETMRSGTNGTVDPQEVKILERETNRLVDNCFRTNQKTILSVVQSTLEKFPRELHREMDRQLSSFVSKSIAQGLFDERLTASHTDLIDKLTSDLSKETLRKWTNEFERKYKTESAQTAKNLLASAAKKVKVEKFLSTGKSMQSEARSSNMNSQMEDENPKLPALKNSSGLRTTKQSTIVSGEDLLNEYAELNSACFGPAAIEGWEKLIQLILNTLDTIESDIPDVFQGQIYDDEVSGFGVIFKDGQQVYRGEFKDNKALGVGELKLTDTCVYRGMVDKLAPQSYGIMIQKDLIQKALFANGKKTGTVIKTKLVSKQTANKAGHRQTEERVVGLVQYSETGDKDGLSVQIAPQGEALSVYEKGNLVEYRVLPRGTFSVFRHFSKS